MTYHTLALFLKKTMITKIDIPTEVSGKVLSLCSVESDSLTPLVSINIGTEGREIEVKLAQQAVSNAKNVGLKTTSLFITKNTVKEDPSKGGEVIFENHPDNSNLVVVTVSKESRSVPSRDLSQALMVYSRK